MKEPGVTFAGFMIQAVRADRGTDVGGGVGSFQAIPGTKRICREVSLRHPTR